MEKKTNPSSRGVENTQWHTAYLTGLCRDSVFSPSRIQPGCHRRTAVWALAFPSTSCLHFHDNQRDTGRAMLAVTHCASQFLR